MKEIKGKFKRFKQQQQKNGKNACGFAAGFLPNFFFSFWSG